MSNRINWGLVRNTIYFCVVVGLITANIITIIDLFPQKEVKVLVYEEIPTIIETNEIEVEQRELTPRAVQMHTNDFTVDEAQLLMKVAQAEAGNQGEDGMWLVMSVVYNRVQSEEFPNSVTEVIYQPHQFSTVSNNSINKVEVSSDCHNALARIESGDVAEQIIGFETTDSNALDKYFTCVFRYRDHKFYVPKKEERK